MKEIEQKQQTKIEIIKQAKKDIQRVLFGTIKPQKNHTVFEVNIAEKTIGQSSRIHKIIKFIENEKSTNI